MKNLIKLSTILMAFSWAGLAQAGDVDCDTSYEGNVTPTTDCALGHESNDNPQPDQVNDDEMFGFDDWMFAQKWDASTNMLDGTNIDVGFEIDGDAQSGDWSIDDIWGLYTHVMIVLKGPNESSGVDPSVYVGWLIENGATSGTYSTPFSSGGEVAQGTSHWSIYVRGPVSVPEPGTMALLGLGLVGIGLTRRRKKS